MRKITPVLLAVLCMPVLVSCGGGSSPGATDMPGAEVETELAIGAAQAETDNAPLVVPNPSATLEPSERVTSPIVREKVNVCEVDSLDSLRECVANAASYGGLDILSDLSCTDNSCCEQNGALVSLRAVSGFTIHGNSHIMKREAGHRQCGLLEITSADDVVVENWFLDDDVTVAGCSFDEHCPRMVYVRNSKDITLDNVAVSNGKDYSVYIDGVEGFTFQNSTVLNAGVLGLYVGHADNFSSEVVIENSLFVDVETNAVALLGVGGGTTNVVRNNTFLRNHRHGHWEVEPRFGTGTTGGGQIYIARADNVLVEGNTILDGYCDNCYISSGSRTGIHGIELGEPGQFSISNIEIRDNIIGNHDAGAIYLNQGSSVNSTVRISNNILHNNTESLQKGLLEGGATIGANDSRETSYFESFENSNLTGNDFSVSGFCASNSSVASVCNGESLFGSCAASLSLGDENCADAHVALESRWYDLQEGLSVAASGWVVNGFGETGSSEIGDWCLEFADANGEITGLECEPISVNDSTVQRIHGLPLLDVTPPQGSSVARWVARNTGSDALILDDIKISGVR